MCRVPRWRAHLSAKPAGTGDIAPANATARVKNNTGAPPRVNTFRPKNSILPVISPYIH